MNSGSPTQLEAIPAGLISTPLTEALVRGALDFERSGDVLVPQRLPLAARMQADGQMLMAQSHCSGVRLVFSTSARVIVVETRRTTTMLRGLPPRPAGVFDLLIDGELSGQRTAAGGTVGEVDMSTGAQSTLSTDTAPIVFDGLPSHRKDVEIWLPWNEAVGLVRLRSDAPLEPTPLAPPVPRLWLHHGSSISHGSNAQSPTGSWTALAAAAGGVELLNLGFGGSALLDQYVARTIRDTPADLTSLKIGINIVNADLFRMRALGSAVDGFLDTIRDGHPNTPLLVVTALHCGIHEQTPGPGAFDPAAVARGQMLFRATGDPGEISAGRLTLQVIRAELERVVTRRATADPALFLLDGMRLYGAEDEVAHPLPDNLHPDADTHRLIAQRFTHAVFATGGAFAVGR